MRRASLAVLPVVVSIPLLASLLAGERARAAGPGAGPVTVPVKPAGSYVKVAPPKGEPIPRTSPGTWAWVAVPGAVCRDGSPTGFYVKFSDASPNVAIYLEGGGACFNKTTCEYTPKNVNQKVVGETVATMRAQPVQQKPWTTGLFDQANAQSPIKGWSMVYVPYCTGDVYGGSKPNAHVAEVPEAQQFVGFTNMTKFLSRIIPTFAGARQVLLSGSSAGGVGAAINFPQAQDGFGPVPVTLVDDSGPVLADEFVAPCLQKSMRELWNLNAALPPDCKECFHADGGGLGVAPLFLRGKYPNQRLAVVSSQEDEVMRFFYGWGERSCQAGPYPKEKYRAALADFRDGHEVDKNQLATFFYAGKKHTVLELDRFYTEQIGGKTVAQWVSDLLAGRSAQLASP